MKDPVEFKPLPYRKILTLENSKKPQSPAAAPAPENTYKLNKTVENSARPSGPLSSVSELDK